MSALPATITALFNRQTAKSLHQNLRVAFESGETNLFDGAVRWKLEAFEAERVWEGEAASFDDMTGTLIGTLNGFIDGREDHEVQLTLQEA
ncbi:MAG: hypothetical protein AAF213_00495 [Pseudomonadota bacterium]